MTSWSPGGRLPRGGEGVQVALRRAGATAWSPPLSLDQSAARAGGVRATLGPQGRALVAWYEGSGGAAPVTRVQAALLPPGARRIAITTLGTARSRLPRFGDPPAAAFTGSGRTVVAWTAKGPASVNDRVTPLGRVVAAVSSPAGVFRAPRRLDDRAAAGQRGRVRQRQRTRARHHARAPIGRGSNGPALAPRVGGAVVGVWTEDDSSDLGRHLRSLVLAGRPLAGRPLPVAPAFIDDPLDEFSLPYARYPAAIADAQGGGYCRRLGLALQRRPLGRPGVGRERTRRRAPVRPLEPGRPAGLEGVGVTRAGTAVVALGAAGLGPENRALWAATRAAGGSGAFGPAEEAELVGDLVGKPHSP